MSTPAPPIRLEDIAQRPTFMERVKQDPFVPLGCLLTLGCLVGGLVSFRQGNKMRSQTFMRARVVAQGATLAFFTASTFYAAYRQENQA